MAALLEAREIVKRYGGLTAVNELTLNVEPGTVNALIGPNGAGKSTLFKMLSGEVRPTSGEIFFKGARLTGMNATEVCRRGISKSYQTTQIFPNFTVIENIAIPALANLRGSFRLDPFRRMRGVRGLADLVGSVLHSMGLEERAETRAGDLAYGEKRRLEIGLALATRPDLLLLDEPTAGMSPEESKSTVDLIKELRKTVTIVVVEHDMDVVFELADRITVMHEGRKIAEGPPSEIRVHPAVREAYLGGTL